jgi:ferredoxin
VSAGRGPIRAKIFPTWPPSPHTEPGLEKWLELNRQYSAVWPNITRKKPAPPDADAFVGVPDKFAKYFSSNPGEGD